MELRHLKAGEKSNFRSRKLCGFYYFMTLLIFSRTKGVLLLWIIVWPEGSFLGMNGFRRFWPKFGSFISQIARCVTVEMKFDSQYFQDKCQKSRKESCCCIFYRISLCFKEHFFEIFFRIANPSNPITLRMFNSSTLKGEARKHICLQNGSCSMGI